MTARPQTDVPARKITVDGNLDDWDGCDADCLVSFVLTVHRGLAHGDVDLEWQGGFGRVVHQGESLRHGERIGFACGAQKCDTVTPSLEEPAAVCRQGSVVHTEIFFERRQAGREHSFG